MALFGSLIGLGLLWYYTPAIDKVRTNITGYLFISPAMAIITVFGLFPIAYAVYMSFWRWRVKQGAWRGLQNYLDVIGDWDGLLLFSAGFILLFFAYWVWMEAFKTRKAERTRRHEIHTVVLAASGLFTLYRGRELQVTDQVDWMVFAVVGLALIGSAGAVWTQFFGPKRDGDDSLLRLIPAFLLLGVSLFAITYGYDRMLNGVKHEEYLEGMVITFYYAFGSVPIQLSVALVLAYILYQNIKGKEMFRMVFFLPYVTPAVASAVVFRTVFARESTSLANQLLGLIGLDSQKWLYESKPFLNAMFGLNLEGFLAGPSMALVSIILLGVWTSPGYTTVIFLAGLGSIPSDLYEAARVDGASNRHLFRHITLPLLSPITFYLSILAFIGTFKAFNHIYVMRVPQSRGTADTASIVVFDTFKVDREYGLATAQAIILFLTILALTQMQRNIFEKRVFYG